MRLAFSYRVILPWKCLGTKQRNQFRLLFVYQARNHDTGVMRNILSKGKSYQPIVTNYLESTISIVNNILNLNTRVWIFSLAFLFDCTSNLQELAACLFNIVLFNQDKIVFFQFLSKFISNDFMVVELLYLFWVLICSDHWQPIFMKTSILDSFVVLFHVNASIQWQL